MAHGWRVSLERRKYINTYTIQSQNTSSLFHNHSLICHNENKECISGKKKKVTYFSSKYKLHILWHLVSSLVAMGITKTRLCNFDPLKPHFYIVKLGITGVYIIFLISDQNIDCRYSLEPPRRGGSNEYPQSMFWAEIWKKYQSFLSKNFQFLEVRFSIYNVFE